VADDTHGCPGDCGARVPRRLLACKPCWFRLPTGLRDAVNDAYRRRRADPTAHRDALRAAMTWYRDNPKEAARG
jgi:hypothetical protein